MAKHRSAVTAVVAAVFVAGAAQAEAPEPVFDWTTHWVGDTFARGDRWVQNYVLGIEVDADGTIYTTSHWDEAGRRYGVYKDGDVIGNDPQRGQQIDPFTIVDHDGVTWEIESVWGRFFRDGHSDPPPQALDARPVIRSSAGHEISDVVDPVALAVDNDNRLMVFDHGPRQQILYYDTTGEQPVKVDTFGEYGGIFAGDEPGAMGDDRLYGVRGMGVDAQGNLYVANNGYHWMGGTDLRAYTPDGEMKWQLLGVFFTQAADFAPGTDGRIIHNNSARFAMDYDQPPGESWSYLASTLNPFSYPDDPRVHEALETTWMREIDGRTYMFKTNMYSEFLVGYRFEGNIAVPMMKIAVDWDGQWDKYVWAMDRRPQWDAGAHANRRWIWTDQAGDGQVHADEFDTFDIGYAFIRGLHVDDRGDIWIAHRQILRLPNQGVDEHGSLTYDIAELEREPIPDAFHDVTRLEYKADEDVMYLAGDGQFPGMQKIIRYDGWASGEREQRFVIEPPYDRSDDFWENNIYPFTFTVVDDFVFVGMGAKGPLWDTGGRPGDRFGELLVYDADTGAFVQYLYPGEEVHHESGALDLPYAINGMRREDGSYLIIVEENRYGKNLVYEFVPEPASSSMLLIGAGMLALRRTRARRNDYARSS